jgi:hypothetical protein
MKKTVKKSKKKLKKIVKGDAFRELILFVEKALVLVLFLGLLVVTLRSCYH